MALTLGLGEVEKPTAPLPRLIARLAPSAEGLAVPAAVVCREKGVQPGGL
eukprot:SAG22_NODE_1450_length_4395_cov_19.169926_3_plen_50_part_00